MRRMIAGLCAALAVPASANTQPLPNDPVVVTGLSRPAARKLAQSYVRDLGVATGEQQAARWLVPVCPRVVGIGKDQAKWATQRIRAIARQVGAPLAKEGCSSNLVVIFTDSANQTVDYLSKHPPGRLGSPGSTRTQKLRKGGMPVRWWYNVSNQTNFGVPEGSDTTPGLRLEGYANVSDAFPVNHESTVTHHFSASLVNTQIARGIYAATIVVDVNLASPARVASLSDFAALVGLAEISLDASPDNSILSLFDQSPEQLLISAWDISFLTGLYRIAMDRQPNLHRQMLVQEMLREKARSTAN